MPRRLVSAKPWAPPAGPCSCTRAAAAITIFFSFCHLLNQKMSLWKGKIKQKSRRKMSLNMLRVLFAMVLNRAVAKHRNPTPDPLANWHLHSRFCWSGCFFHTALFLAVCAAFSAPCGTNDVGAFLQGWKATARRLVVFQIKSASLCSNLGCGNERGNVKVSFSVRGESDTEWEREKEVGGDVANKCCDFSQPGESHRAFYLFPSIRRHPAAGGRGGWD